MHQEQSLALVQEFLEVHGLAGSEEPAPSAQEEEAGDAAEWLEYISVEVDPETSSLTCWAYIDDFDSPPEPALLEALEAEAQLGTETGGGRLRFDPRDNGLYLTRTYTEPLPVEQLTADLWRLYEASETWSDEVMERALSRQTVAVN